MEHYGALRKPGRVPKRHCGALRKPGGVTAPLLRSTEEAGRSTP